MERLHPIQRHRDDKGKGFPIAMMGTDEPLCLPLGEPLLLVKLWTGSTTKADTPIGTLSWYTCAFL